MRLTSRDAAPILNPQLTKFVKDIWKRVSAISVETRRKFVGRVLRVALGAGIAAAVGVSGYAIGRSKGPNSVRTIAIDGGTVALACNDGLSFKLGPIMLTAEGGCSTGKFLYPGEADAPVGIPLYR